MFLCGEYASMCFDDTGQLVYLRGRQLSLPMAQQEDSVFIQVRNHHGRTVSLIKSACSHQFCPVLNRTPHQSSILEACFVCNVLRLYAENTSCGPKIVLQGCKPSKLCHGPSGTVLVATLKGDVLQLRWNEAMDSLEELQRFPVTSRQVKRLHYVPQNDVVVVSLREEQTVRAFNLSNQSRQWEFPQQVGTKVPSSDKHFSIFETYRPLPRDNFSHLPAIFSFFP